MVRLPTHNVLMSDKADHARRLTPEFAKLRGVHLEQLTSLESMVRQRAPVPVSYDIGRSQPPYFSEATYTEMLGGLYLAPQSSEIAVRITTDALVNDEQGSFDAASAVLASRQGPLDKYKLQVPKDSHKKIAFIPGSNIFSIAVSKELLSRAMEDDEVMIKPHPMTNDETLRTLGMSFGYDRVLEPKASGWHYLAHAEEIFVPTTSEIGLYGILLDKKINNITSYVYESTGAYFPFYTHLWGRDDAKARLKILLNSTTSGFYHIDDPESEKKMDLCFERMLFWRDYFKPLVPNELTSAEWGAARIAKLKGPEVAVRKS